MTVLDRYIGAAIAKGYLIIIFILLSLFSFLALVDDLDNVGTGNYRLGDAFVFTSLMLPRRIVELAPVAALLGSVIALGGLATGNELLAMQAGGWPTTRIAMSVLRAGACLILMVVVLDAFVAPPLEQLAHGRHTVLISGSHALRTERGLWFRDHHRFINVQTIRPGGIPHDIDVYQFDEMGRLLSFTHAQEAGLHAPNQWVLRHIEQKLIDESGITVRRLDALPVESFLTHQHITLLTLPPESLSPSDLYRYIRSLEGSGQNADRHALALWQKGSMPLATGAMVLLAIPFTFGPLRVVTTGWRILLASVVGIAFHLLNQILGNVGLLFSLHPAVTTLVPAAVVFGAALWLLRAI